MSRKLAFFLFLLIAATIGGISWDLHRNGVSVSLLLKDWLLVLSSPKLLIVLLLSVAIYFTDALRYRVFARAFGIRLGYSSCLRASIGCLLFSWISPGAVLGAPSAAYLLKQTGLDWEDAAVISFGKSLSGSLLLLLSSIPLITLGFLPGGVSSPSSLFLLACLAVYVALLFTPPLKKRLHTLLRAGRSALFLILLSHLLYFFILISVLVVLAVILGAHSIGRTYALSGLYTTLLYMSPTPAGAGVGEAAANTYFGNLLNPSRALVLVIAYRCITHYAQILFGVFYFSATSGMRLFREVVEPEAHVNEPKAHPIDWVGKWFEILEEQGEFARIPFGRFGSNNGDPEWVFLKHEDYDGVGGMAHLLRNEGYRIDKLPGMKEPVPPGWFRGALALARTQRQNRICHMPWKKYDPTRLPVSQADPVIAWHRFTEEDSRRIETLARNHQVSTNTYLFWHLDQSVLPLFRGSDFNRLWMVPVNMRGGVTRERDTANQSAYIGVSISAGTPLPALHQQIHREIRRNSHWGAWYSILSGRLIGVTGMRRLLGWYRKNGSNWVGIFSNGGEWPRPDCAPPERSPPEIASAWIAAVPVTQGHPVGGGSLTWKGRIGITLQFHPSLGENHEGVLTYLADWKKRILSRE